MPGTLRTTITSSTILIVPTKTWLPYIRQCPVVHSIVPTLGNVPDRLPLHEGKSEHQRPEQLPREGPGRSVDPAAASPR